MIHPFSIARLPRIEFGAGRFAKLAELITGYGRRVLLVTGRQSLENTAHWSALIEALRDQGVEWQRVKVSGEPSPELVDEAVAAHRDAGIDVVVGIGGGSVLDAAKAIAGLLIPGNSVMDHLEGVGPEKPYEGPAVPFIAVPTTAGTGSEATKNSVLTRHGEGGFKKSFRDSQLVARVAMVDPDLLATCPAGLIAADGMDALTQLMESYVSLRANAMTDALALSGIEAARDGLLPWFEQRGDQQTARSYMAYASMLSGVTLAQTSLGSVHGLASPLGAFFPIPHGVVCGTLVAAATQINIRALNEREPDHPTLTKYAHLGRLLTGRDYAQPAEAHKALVELLEEWTQRLQLERLAAYGVTTGDFERIVANSRGSSMKTNPIVLTDAEIGEILAMRI